MMSQSGKQTIAMPNILRSTGNQTMKFVQLIDYNMKNIFLEDWNGVENIPRPIPEKSKFFSGCAKIMANGK